MAKTLLKSHKKKISLSKYAGRWVAFVDDSIVAFDDTLKGLMEKVKKIGLEKKASTFLVPRKDEGPYILIIL